MSKGGQQRGKGRGKKTTECPFPGIKLTRDSRGGVSSGSIAIASSGDPTDPPYPKETMAWIFKYQEENYAWVDATVQLAKDYLDKTMEGVDANDIQGPMTQAEYIESRGYDLLSNEMIAVHLGKLGGKIFDPDISRMAAISAALNFARIAALWESMRVPENQGATGGNAANKIRDAQSALMRRAIGELMRQHPGKRAATLLRLLPECDDDPLEPNAGDFTIWRHGVTIHAANDGTGGRGHCGKSTFYKHVAVLGTE